MTEAGRGKNAENLMTPYVNNPLWYIFGRLCFSIIFYETLNIFATISNLQNFKVHSFETIDYDYKNSPTYLSSTNLNQLDSRACFGHKIEKIYKTSWVLNKPRSKLKIQKHSQE